MSETSQLMDMLKKASTEPEARPAFYEILLKSVIFAPGLRREGQDGSPPQLNFKQWTQPEGFMAIPFFSDQEDLKKVLGEEEPFIGIPALDLFRLTRGTTLVLTNASGQGKAFKPDEVDMILSSELAMDPLAAALEKAVREGSEEARSAFYLVFVNSRVFVFGEPRNQDGETGPKGMRAPNPEDKFIIATTNNPQKEGERIIPFFSSLDIMQRAAKAAGLPSQATFLGFPALELLKIAKGMGLPLVMNLGPATYKIFNPDEIDFLLAQTRPRPYEERQLPAGSKVSLAPPEDYPQEMVKALLDFLPGLPEVKTAYLATMKDDSAEAVPVLVIGLETEEGADTSEILHKAAPLVTSHAPKGQAIDFTQVKPGEKGLSQLILSQISPFYRRPLTPGNAEPAVPAPATPETTEAQDESPGLFGRLKRIFKG
jgi:hypothetical protein